MLFCRWSGLVSAICGIVLTATSVLGAPITKIADTAGGYSALSLPSVNNAGTVAFRATTTGTAKVFTAAGGSISTVFDPAAFAGSEAPAGDPSINDTNQVAFSGATSIWRITAGSLQQMANLGGLFPTYYGVSAGNDGNVYFSGGISFPSSNANFFASSSGSGPNYINASSFQQQGFTRGAVSANGSYNAVSYNHTGSGPVNSLSENGAVVANPSGPHYSNPFPGTLQVFGEPDVNSAGTIILYGNYNGVPQYDAVFTLKNGAYTQIAAGKAIPAINDAGTLAALFTTGTKTIMYGAGNLSSTLITVGDALDGSTVTDLGFAHEGLSEGNQLAFFATLADGRQGIYETALAVPEPTTAGLIGVALVGLLARRRKNS